MAGATSKRRSRAEERSTETYRTDAVGTRRGGIVVLPTVRGLNDFVPPVCDRLSAAGFAVVALNPHHRMRSTPLRYEEDYTALLGASSEQRALEDVDAAFAQLVADGVDEGRLAVVGFALGGSGALLAACRRRFACAISFYAAVSAAVGFGFPDLLPLATELQTPWLGIFAEQDPGTPVAEVEALGRQARPEAVELEATFYPGTVHGFLQQDRADLYRPAEADDAWRRATAWLDRYVPRL